MGGCCSADKTACNSFLHFRYCNIRIRRKRRALRQKYGKRKHKILLRRQQDIGREQDVQGRHFRKRIEISLRCGRTGGMRIPKPRLLICKGRVK